LYGAWGAGKSTCLSFIEHYVRRSEHYEDQLTIVKFNPWWFSGQEDLAIQFFNQLLATISAVDPDSEDLRKRLADFAQLVSRLPIPYAWTGEAVADILRPEGKDVTLSLRLIGLVARSSVWKADRAGAPAV